MSFYRNLLVVGLLTASFSAHANPAEKPLTQTRAAMVLAFSSYKVLDTCPAIVIEKSGQKLGQAIVAAEMLVDGTLDMKSFKTTIEKIGELELFENFDGSVTKACLAQIDRIKVARKALGI